MKYILLSCILIMLISCQQPVQEIPAVEETITETIPEPEIETVPEPEITEELIMERTIVMNPIPDALGYLFKNGLLKGIAAETGRKDFLQIAPKADINGTLCGIVLNDFFVKNGKKYFSFTDRYQDENEADIEKEMHYEQTGLTVKEIEIMPDKPVATGKIEGTYGTFVFSLYDWESVEYNKLMRGNTIVSTANGFDSAILTDNGILFSQPETLSRISGLWYMGNTQNGGPTRIGDYQIIY